MVKRNSLCKGSVAFLRDPSGDNALIQHFPDWVSQILVALQIIKSGDSRAYSMPSTLLRALNVLTH